MGWSGGWPPEFWPTTRPDGWWAEVLQLDVADLTLDVPGRRLLTEVALTVQVGECVAILGASGAGKTSLLNCVAGVQGSVRIDGTMLSVLSPAKRAEFRLKHIGIVFQFGELLPELSLVENVAIPLRLLGVPRREAEKRAQEKLERLGLGGQAAAHPNSLSGGEVQRAGIARSLVHRPSLVLADEPTGMLDEVNTRLVADLLGELARESRVAVLLATHDPIVSSSAARVLRIRDGRLVGDGLHESSGLDT